MYLHQSPSLINNIQWTESFENLYSQHNHTIIGPQPQHAQSRGHLSFYINIEKNQR